MIDFHFGFFGIKVEVVWFSGFPNRRKYCIQDRLMGYSGLEIWKKQYFFISSKFIPSRICLLSDFSKFKLFLEIKRILWRGRAVEWYCNCFSNCKRDFFETLFFEVVNIKFYFTDSYAISWIFFPLVSADPIATSLIWKNFVYFYV